ncbi:MAG: TonB-dependent receptor [Pseudomonadota bacterium]
MGKFRSSTALAVLALASATAAVAQPQDRFTFDLPTEALSQALRDVAVRSGRNVIAPAELVGNRQASPLTGTFTAEAAVARLLAGTGLRYRLVEGTLVVERAPLEVADDAPARASAQDIVVTGTHVRGASPTSPLIVLTRKDIDRTGATAVDELMRTLPQNSESGVNKENTLISLPDVDPSDHGSALNLRGLGQRATLVLLDGRRLAPSGTGGFVDVSMIPLSAIERVDVLTDGASAIYGSDAVGGVVNFVLRDHFNGFETTARVGTTTDGGGSQVVLSQAAGKAWGSGHALLAYEFRLEDEVKAGQRAFTINEPSKTFLLPHERKNSLIGTVEQDLAPSLRAKLTATYSRRRTDRTVFQAGSPLPVMVNAKARQGTLAAELAYDLPKNWLLTLDGNYARTTTAQIQTQPGGTPIVNDRDVRSSVAGSELHLDGPLVDLPGGAVRVALGGEIRKETFHQVFGSSAFASDTTSARRSVASVYGELAIPVFSPANRRPGLEVLQLSAAARYDRYSHTGSSFDPKVGLLWSPLAGLNVRGSYSTSFRAPLLSETTGAYGGILDPAYFFFTDPSQAPPGSILLFLQGSNPNVKPETSRNWTLGADLSPGLAPGLKLTANYYSIRYSNRIAMPTSTVVVVGNPAYNSIVEFNPDPTALAAVLAGTQFLDDFTGPGFTNGHATANDVYVVLDDRVTNTAFTATSGLDLGLRYAFKAGDNHFVADANLTHIFKFEDQLRPDSPVIDELNHPYQSLRWRARGGINWANGGWGGGLFVNYAGHYVDNRTSVTAPVKAYATVDATLSYSFPTSARQSLRGTTISLYAENLLDTDPPFLAPDQGRSTAIGYDPVNASARGRFVAVQLRRGW